MVDKILDKQRNNSELISKLINNFESLTKVLDEKSKVNHIFHEFDEHLRKDLNSLVKLSNERYKSVKSGNKVIKIFNKQKDKLSALVSSVANDQLYKSEDVYEEKKKLNQPPIRNSEINNIRLKLRDIQPAQGVNHYKPRLNTLIKDLPEHHRKSDSDYLTMLNHEKKGIHNSIQGYLNLLNDLKVNPNLRDELYKKKFNLFSENLQFLNFKETQSHSVEKKTVQNELIDIQKLLNLAKSKKKAKQQYFENKKHKRSKSYDKESYVNDSFGSMSKIEPTQLFQHTMIPQNNNPISIIKNGIAKSYHIEENFKDKNDNITTSLGEMRLPQIEEYQKLIAKFLNAKKLIQMTEGSGMVLIFLKKNDRDFQEKLKTKKRFGNEENLNSNFLTEIKKIKRKPLTYIDDYSKRDFINEKLMELNKYLSARNIDRKKLNRKIDEYLLVQEKQVVEDAQQLKVDIEKVNKKNNKANDNFKKKFVNNLYDPSFNIEVEDSSTRDLDLFEKSSIKRVIISPSDENVLANYNNFKNFKENIEVKEKDKSNNSLIIETDKNKDNEMKQEMVVKNSPKFQNFSNFIFNNDTTRILNLIKDSNSVNKNPNIYEKLSSNTLELPIILNKNKKVEGSRGKNHMYNLNLNTNSNERMLIHKTK